MRYLPTSILLFPLAATQALAQDHNIVGTIIDREGEPIPFGWIPKFQFPKKKLNYFGGYGWNFRSTPGYGNSVQSFLTTFQWRARQFLLTFTYRLSMKNGDLRVSDDAEDFSE